MATGPVLVSFVRCVPHLGLAFLLAAVAPVPAAGQGRIALGVTAPGGAGSEYHYPAPSLLGAILVGAPAVEAQEGRTASTAVGFFAGGFDYYFGDGSFYPLFSGRFRVQFSAVFAVEASLTGVAAEEAVVNPNCANAVRTCVHEVHVSLVYPAVGLQIRLPAGRVSPFVGASVGALVQAGALSPSLEVGVVGRYWEGIDVVLEARRRFDQRYDLVTTRATEVSVGVYWTGR